LASSWLSKTDHIGPVILFSKIHRRRARDIEGALLVGHSKTIKSSFGTVEYAVKGEGEPMLMAYGAGGGFAR
jgi:hypothetical protein